jgi:hypothetical protein
LIVIGPVTVSGRVVRAFAAADKTSLYPHSAALEFYTPHFELDLSTSEPSLSEQPALAVSTLL